MISCVHAPSTLTRPSSNYLSPNNRIGQKLIIGKIQILLSRLYLRHLQLKGNLEKKMNRLVLLSVLVLTFVGCGSAPAAKKEDAGTGGAAPAVSVVATASATVVPSAEPTVTASASSAPALPSASAAVK